MNILSPMFFAMVAVMLLIYYRLPRQHQWKLLLAGSLIFILSYDVRFLFFVLFSSFSVWIAALRICDSQKNSARGEGKKYRKHVLQFTLILNLSILILLKYIAPVIQDYRIGLRGSARVFLPIGISYYTLQMLSYVIDVYWGRIEAEKSYGRILLFVTYFPQLLQGPISRYGDLSEELFVREHPFDGRNIKHGVQLILWGMLQMTVIADFFVSELPAVDTDMYGLTMFLGLALFGLQLYCNFSGGINLVLGVSQCFGISLPENFRQPFFSRSLGEFWRRWHITLGAWMKDYVFFPLSMSHTCSQLKKKLRKRLPRKTATSIVIAISDIAVFLLVGIWHGTGLNYAIWGLYNGVILAFSELMAPCYAWAREKLKIRTESLWWKTFCTVRTFFLVTIGWSTDCAVTAGGTWALIANMLAVWKTNLELYHLGLFQIVLLVLSVLVLVAVGMIREKGYSVRGLLDRAPFAVQVIFWAAVIQFIALMGKIGAAGGLMYAIF